MPAAPPRGASRDRLAAAAIAAYAVALGPALMAGGVRLTQEDGFYYFKIAQHVAAGRGSTFDGLNPTNGYHPLWMLCLVPVFRASPDGLTAVTVAGLLQGALLAASAVLVFRTARLGLGLLASSLAALVWVGLTHSVALSGVEFALCALGVTGMAYSYWRWFGPGAQAEGAPFEALGLLAAATFLARLDTLLLAAVVAGSFWFRSLGGPWKRGALRFACPVALACAAYAGLNAWMFGSPVPVSGIVKRAWSAQMLGADSVLVWLAAKADHMLRPFRGWRAWPNQGLVLGSFGAAALALVHVLGRGGGLLSHLGRVLVPLWPFVAFSLLQVLTYGLVYHGIYSFARWYYVVQPLLAALLIAAAADFVAARFTPGARSSAARHAGACRAGMAVVMALWCSVPLGTLRSAVRWRDRELRDRPPPLYRAARWAREYLPPDVRIGAWNAGAIGFLSERQVVNLDGVANTVRYARVEQYDLCGYWERMGITHLVDVFEGRPGSKAMTGPALPVTAFYARCADRLELLWSDGAEGEPGWAKAFRLRRRAYRPRDDARPGGSDSGRPSATALRRSRSVPFGRTASRS